MPLFCLSRLNIMSSDTGLEIACQLTRFFSGDELFFLDKLRKNIITIGMS